MSAAERLQLVSYDGDPCEDADDLRNTPKNQAECAKARGLLQSALIILCRKGHFGEITLRLTSKDGTIQNVETGVQQNHR